MQAVKNAAEVSAEIGCTLQAPGLFAGVLAASGIYDVLRLAALGGAAMALPGQAKSVCQDDA